jgi:hypothetical protein
MKQISVYKLFSLILFLPALASAQDITGLWKGEMYVDSVKLHLPYEILISESKGKLVGYSRVIFFKDGIQGGIEEPGIQDITIKQNGEQVTIEDEGFLEHNFSIKPPKQVKKTMLLTLIVSDTDIILKGSWSTNRTKYYLVATGTAELKRKNDYKVTALYKRLDTLKLTSKLVINPPVAKQVPIVAIATVPAIKMELPKVQEPLPEPELIIPPIKQVVFDLVPIFKKQAVTTARISGPSSQKKALYNSITATKLIYIPKETPAVIAVAEKPFPKAEPTTVIPPNIKPAPAPTNSTTVITKPAPAPAVVAFTPKPKSEPAVAAVPKPAQAILTPAVPKPKPVVTTQPAPQPVIAKVVAAEKKPLEIVTPPAPKPVPETIAAPVAIITPSIMQGAAELDKRSIISEQSFYFESDSLVLTLYDNGDVDGDTVTVVMNGNVIFSRQGLSTRANTKTIKISPQTDSVKLVMYAENLGEIPPNTGLLVVMDGEKRYDVRFTADLKSNAAIVLRRRLKQ